MAKTLSGKHTSKKIAYKKNSAISISTSSDRTHEPRSIWKKLLTWLGWGIVYVFVFYLGNLSGEYVASHMPILPSLPALPRVAFDGAALKKLIPSIDIPNISIAWKWPKITPANKPSAPSSPKTSLVIVQGNFIQMPLASASDADRKIFVDSVRALAVDATDISIAGSCEASPAFVRVNKGALLSVTNASDKDHTVTIESSSKVITAKQKVSIPLTQIQGAYAIYCDGSIVGFYHVN